MLIDTSFTLNDVDTAGVTPEQIGRCSKVWDNQLYQMIWMTQSESDPLKEYRTYWSELLGPVCTCKAGQDGFSHCRNGRCKHIAWIAAAQAEETAAIAELEQAIKAQAVKSAQAAAAPTIDLPTRARIAAASERAAQRPASKARANSPRAFSILKTA